MPGLCSSVVSSLSVVVQLVGHQGQYCGGAQYRCLLPVWVTSSLPVSVSAILKPERYLP